MIHRDPFEALTTHYEHDFEVQADDGLLGAIYKARSLRLQKLFSASYGFVLAATVALILLSVAAIPPTSADDKTATAIARYQMINSGLVERNVELRDTAR